MSTQANEIREGQNYVQILNFDEDNDEVIDEKRRILQTLVKDKFKKYKSQILNKKYIGGVLKLLKINTDKLKFIKEEIIIPEFIVFIEFVSISSFETGDVLKPKADTFTILIEGIVHKMQTQQNKNSNFLNVLTDYSVKKKLLSLSKRKRKNSTLKIKKNQIVYEEDTKRKEKLKKIMSNNRNEPKIIFNDYHQSRQYQCLSAVSTGNIPRTAINKLESFLQRTEKEEIGKYLCRVLGLQECVRSNKLAIKVEKLNFHKNKKIEINESEMLIIYEGTIMLNLQNMSNVILQENSIINPCLQQNQNKSNFSAHCKQQSIILALNKQHILQTYQLYPQYLQQVRLKLSLIRNQRDRMVKKQKSKYSGSFEELQEYNLNSENFNHIIGLHKNYPNRFRVNRDQAKIITNWNQGQHFDNYPYMKLMESYSQVSHLFQSYRKQRSTLKKQNNPNYSCIKNNSSQNCRYSHGKIDPKKHYYNEKVRKMKIKNIAQRIIPNAGKKNFKSDEVERKILQNSLFTTVIQYPMGGSKVSETIKKKDKQKRSIYCVSIEKKKTKQSQQYQNHSIFDEDTPFLFKTFKKQLSTNFSTSNYTSKEERKTRFTENGKQNKRKELKKGREQQGSAKVKDQKILQQVDIRRIRTLGDQNYD